MELCALVEHVLGTVSCASLAKAKAQAQAKARLCKGKKNNLCKGRDKGNSDSKALQRKKCKSA